LLKVLEGAKSKIKAWAVSVAGEDLFLTDCAFFLCPQLVEEENKLPPSSPVRALIPFLKVK
jgi:hypothetical protein